MLRIFIKIKFKLIFEFMYLDNILEMIKFIVLGWIVYYPKMITT